ncbi:sensor histidine kinase inhibitor, KipI family [Terrimicrobium sacchariphilum]|uniref:Sensor histidine kinase inhibitor, KipI family n=1 Tax=Terrimicrobium sacchariphilum TaxID=690879 RepID=A0A146G2H4_TERSA|nr:allophanate hydrolase subunit 1 [Terrimicrobium sacchariphilum]GAT32035.1 sensor histidine kinase inhibitor, KipI family [Terrimicrobium sacchariphilum]
MDHVAIEHWGPSALIVRFASSATLLSLERCRGLLASLNAAGFPDGTEFVPGYGEILIDLPGVDFLSSGKHLAREAVSKARPIPGEGARLHRLPMSYDGPDLGEFAHRTGLCEAEVIEIHSAPTYDVFLVGFAPGFAYLGPLDPRLHLARRETPRLRVEAGSIGIGGTHTGLYSIASPGGWWLLGRTPEALFDPTRDNATAFRFALGDRVKFEPVS